MMSNISTFTLHTYIRNIVKKAQDKIGWVFVLVAEALSHADTLTSYTNHISLFPQDMIQ